MQSVRSVLLVHNEPDVFRALEEMLKGQGICVYRARRCAEARRILKQPSVIDLVLTDVTLADGTWKDVIRLVRRQVQNTPVIVMSRVVSMRLYLDTQDGGAADFIVPPMAPRDLDYALTTAMHRVVPASIAGAPAPARPDRRSPPALQ
jgi:DNA-binding response OmpR family regulator